MRDLMGRYAYRNIRTPIVEPTALFVRGIGEITDIVEKEMYSFEDRLNGEQARPCAPRTPPGVVRAAIEHNLTYDGGKRLWYMGPMFRHERPQRGRYRQFYQLGAEALGFAGPDVDAELIAARAPAARRPRPDATCASSSTAWASPPSAQAHRAALIDALRAARRPARRGRASVGCTAIRCASSTPRTRRCRTWWRPRRKLLTFLGDASLAHFETVQEPADRQRRALHDQSAAGARAGLLQPHGVRVRHRPSWARRARCAAAGATTACSKCWRQADAGGRLGHGPRARAGAAERAGRRDRAAGARRVCGRSPTPRRCRWRCARCCSTCATPASACRCTPARPMAWAASSRSSRRPTPAAPRFALIFGADELARGEVTVKSLRDGSGAQSASRCPNSRAWAAQTTIRGFQQLTSHGNTSRSRRTGTARPAQALLEHLRHPDHLGVLARVRRDRRLERLAYLAAQQGRAGRCAVRRSGAGASPATTRRGRARASPT